MKLETRESLLYVQGEMETALTKELGRNEQLRGELRDSDAKVADLRRRITAIQDDLQT